MSSPKILVTGASGYIGRHLVPKLLEKGYQVRCLVRDRRKLPSEIRGQVEVHEGDLSNPILARSVLHQIDIAYYLVHSMEMGEKKFQEKDQLLARQFGEIAKEKGVRRIIYLGGLGSDADALSTHLKSRHEVGKLLGVSGVPVTEFRAAVILGSGSLSFEMIRYLTERIPAMICPRWVKTLCQPIAIGDVLSYLTEAIVHPQSQGKIIEIGGKDVLSYAQMLREYAKARGLRRKIIQVPLLTPRLSSYWLRLTTPLPPTVCRALVEGLRNPVICKDQTALQLFPAIQPKGYEEAIALALHQEQRILEEIRTEMHSGFEAKDLPLVQTILQEGIIAQGYQMEISAPPGFVYKIVSKIGGKEGWFYANGLWRLRGMLDWLAGGIGFRQGRRDAQELVQGDRVDFFVVEEVTPYRLIRFRAEMKVPGQAWLQFELSANPMNPNSSYLTQTAYFEPKGSLGLFYWYLLYPIHRLLFAGLCQNIRQRSEAVYGTVKRLELMNKAS